MNQLDILEWLKSNPGKTVSEIREACGDSSLGYKLSQLRKYKMIERKSDPLTETQRRREIRYFPVLSE